MNVNLKKLIEIRNLDKKELSKVLFPKSKHPMSALSRMASGKSSMNEEQLYRLSMFTGLSIDALYYDSMQWKQTAQNGLLRFTLDDYSAIYSPQTGITKIYHLESLLATHVLSSPNQPLSDYLTEINRIVINKSVKS
jgi:hypothetical protein